MVALREPEAAIRPPAERIGVLVRVARAEAAENGVAAVGLAVAVAVRQVHQLGALHDIEAAARLLGRELETQGHGQPLRETPGLIGPAIPIGILQHQDVVAAMLAGLELRVRRRAGYPEAATFIPANLHRADDPEGFVREEVHPEAWAHLEARQLFRRCQRGWVGALRAGGRLSSTKLGWLGAPFANGCVVRSP